MSKLKILIIGHARHGKDALAEAFPTRHGYNFSSSSMAAAKLFIYDLLKGKYGYETFEQCYEDRLNNREEWFQLISQYNREDKARLAKEILRDNEIYVGMRNREEIYVCQVQKLFDLIIWVERPGVQLEDPSSFNIDKSLATICVVNDGTLEDLGKKADTIINAYNAWREFEQSVQIIKPMRR